jgi:hypothetical protein
MLLEQAVQARAHDTWQTLMAQALAGLNGQGRPSTSAEAPGLLAYVAHPLGAHHAPDLCHVQHELSHAVSAPLAATQRAALKAVAQGKETLTRVHEHLHNANGEPAKRTPGWPPKAGACLDQGRQDVDATRQASQWLAGQREPVTQSIRAIGHAYHAVDLERGVRRNGSLMAGDSQHHITTIRTIAQHAPLSETCLERIAQAERVVPTMQATMAFVSREARQQVRQWDVAPPVS